MGTGMAMAMGMVTAMVMKRRKIKNSSLKGVINRFINN